MSSTAPPSIVFATKLMWLLWLLGFASLSFNLYTALRLEPHVPVSLGIMYLLAVVLLALLIHAVAVGRNWARVVYTVMAVVAVLIIGLSLIRAAQTPWPRAIFLAVFLVAYGAILWLLYRADSAPWFRKDRLGAT